MSGIDVPGQTGHVERKRYRKKAVPNAVRREVARRYGAEYGGVTAVECCYCGASGCISWYQARYWPVFSLELDHVVPEYLGGPSTADNLVLACRPCNRGKGHKI